MKKAVLPIVIVGLFLLQAVSQAQTDTVSFTPTQDCCFNFLVKNRNDPSTPTSDFHIKVLTPGVQVRLNPTGPTAPSNWSVSFASTDSVAFETPSTGPAIIRSGMDLGGFIVCFNNTVSSFAIAWRTTFNGNTVSTGVLQLSCPVTCDQAAPTNVGQCCWDWKVDNLNSGHQLINDFHVNILTAGITWQSSTPPTGWQASPTNPGQFSVIPGPAPGGIAPGNSLAGFVTCFNVPVGGGFVSFNVEWVTTLNGKPICRDTVTLRCLPPSCDSLDIGLRSDCCFDFGVRNRNSSGQPTTDLHFAIITPGVTVRPGPTAPAGWSATIPTSTAVDFVTTGPGIPAGGNLNGFGVCFDFAGGVAIPFQIVWSTTDKGVVVCSDTAFLQCSLAPKCDSVSVAPSSGAVCCYNVTLKNRHNTPPGSLNDFHLKILSPGVTFRAGSVSGPWATTSLTATDATFATAASALGSGLDLSGFIFCLDRSANSSPGVAILWESTLSGQVVCSDTFRVVCDFVQSKCDTVRVRAREGCCFNFAVLNRHTPIGPINDFHVLSVTPGVRIKLTPTAPAGWNIPVADSNFVTFATANAAIPPNQALGGFILCFDSIPSTGVFQVKWRTTFNGTLICDDSLYLRCNEDPPVCDSVWTEKPLDNCCYDIGIKNRHWPQSPINDAHFRIITPGASFSTTPIAPGGWVLSGASATAVSFFSQSSQIDPGFSLSGFVLCFDNNTPIGGPIRVVWETTFDQKVICSDTLEFDCRPKPVPCDSVEVFKTLDDCCFDFVVKNRHTSKIDDVHFTVITPGVTIRPVPTAPFGWGLTGFSPSFAYFRTAKYAIPPGGDLSGFVLCFDVSPTAPPVFQVVWQTTLQGKVICEDTLRLRCDQAQTRCDSVTVKSTSLTDCCFEFNLFNIHLPASRLDDFHIDVLTPGVTIRQTPSGPTGWPVTSLTPAGVVFTEATGLGIDHQQNAGPFIVCFDNVPAGQVVTVRWCSSLKGQIVCCDTLRFECPPSQGRCDSVSTKLLSPADCCHDFTLHNLHQPAGLLTDWHVTVLTPGVTIRPTPTAPAAWVVSAFTPTKVDFDETTGAGLPSGSSIGGFNLCFDGVPTTGVVRLQWCSTLGGTVICCDTIAIQCTPSQSGCDHIVPSISDTSRCCWDIAVFNAHFPATSTLTDFHISVLTPGVVILQSLVSGPVGWTATATPTVANWLTGGAPIPSGGSLSGFKICFDAAQINNAPFRIEWRTTNLEQLVCLDTLVLQCPKISGVEQIPGPNPSAFQLYQNYPNPFNPTTMIRFDVATASDVEITVYDATGRTQLYLVKDHLLPGTYEAPFDGSALPSGTYFYRIRAANFVQTRTMVLLK